MSNGSENVGIAFGVVIGAGLATAVGAAVVFIPSLVKLADGRVLAASLGFSAGVMGYVSFIEIFPKSQQSFTEGGFSANSSFNLASLCFFGGTVVMLVCIDNQRALAIVADRIVNSFSTFASLLASQFVGS